MYTTQREVRKRFWLWADTGMFPNLNISRRKITDYSSNGKMHNTDTRTAFCNFVDYLSKSGEISPELAQRVTL